MQERMAGYLPILLHIYILQSLHKTPPSSTLHYKPCTKYFPNTLWCRAFTKQFRTLLCTTKLPQSSSQYYFALQYLCTVFACTAPYYKAYTKSFPVLLCTTTLAQSTPRSTTSGGLPARTAQGGGGSFKDRKPLGEVGCCDAWMAEQIHLSIYLPV